jgi:hypothetical protein
LTEEFIDITHRWYQKRFGEHFGKTVKGIFTDNYSPNFGFLRRSVPWGRNFKRRFKTETGHDIRSVLPGLFNKELPNARANRMLFWRFMGRSYLDSYYKRITDYCAKVGLLSTGHLCLEDGMAEHARQIGDYFEVMRSFSLTAVDQLGPDKKGGRLSGQVGDGENLTGCIKNTSSAALWNGSSRVMCESFGCASYPWELDIGEMRRISGWLFGLGVDLFVPHGLYYSIAGHRKWECTPDHLHNPQWSHYRSWTDWISRLSTASSGGVPLSEVGVLYPIHSLRAGLEVGVVTEADDTDPSCYGHGLGASNVQRCFRWTLEALLKAHVGFETIDEETLAKGSVNGNSIMIPLSGKSETLALKALVLPSMSAIEPATHKILEDFAKAGGLVLCVNDAPAELFDIGTGTVRSEHGIFDNLHDALHRGSNSCPLEIKGTLASAIRVAISDNNTDGDALLIKQLEGRISRPVEIHSAAQVETQLITRSWRREGLTFHYIFNGSPTPVDTQIIITHKNPLTLVDCEDGSLRKLESGEFRRHFGTADGVLVAEGLSGDWKIERQVPYSVKRTIPLDCKWRIQPDRWNVMRLRNWNTSFEANHCVCSMRFKSAIALTEARLPMDLEKSLPELDSHSYLPRLKCVLNGTVTGAFKPGNYADRNIYEADISGLVRKGENLLEISSSAHLLDWEWRLHPPMITGDFSVMKGASDEFSIHPFTNDLTIGSWISQGFPFFSGEFSYKTVADIPAVESVERLFLDCGNITSTAVLYIEGHKVGTCVNPPWRFDLSEFSGRCVNLEIRVANVPHNLFMSEQVDSGLIGPVAFNIADVEVISKLRK